MNNKFENNIKVEEFTKSLDDFNWEEITSQYQEMSLIGGVVLDLQEFVRTAAKYLGIKEEFDRHIERLMMSALTLLKLRDFRREDLQNEEFMSNLDKALYDMSSSILTKPKAFPTDYQKLHQIVGQLSITIPTTIDSFKTKNVIQSSDKN